MKNKILLENEDENIKNKIMLLGLGNTGQSYQYTRHNIGFQIIDIIRRFYKLPLFIEKNKMMFSYGSIKNRFLFICKEKNFINLTGKISKNFLINKEVDIENLIIIHDDLKLKLRKIKIKKSEKSSGHNGIKNLNKYIGNKYIHLKIGIDEPKNNSKEYVLKPFKKQECYHLTIIVQKLLHILPILMEKNFSLFLNRINEVRTKNPQN